MRNLLRKAIGCRSAQTWSGRWGFFNHDTIIGCLRWNLCKAWERIERTPGNLRWELANMLSRWAHRLRGGPSYDLGYWQSGNRAAKLADDLMMAFIPPPQGTTQDDANELIDKIQELARIANSTHWNQ